MEESRLKSAVADYPASANSGIYDRFCLVLKVAEAASAWLDPAAVLRAVGEVLEPVAPVDAIDLVTVRDGALSQQISYLAGPSACTAPDHFSRPAAAVHPMSLSDSATERAALGRRLLVGDTLGREPAFPENRQLLAIGMSCYARAPLTVQDELIGSIAFCRSAARPGFSARELELLEDVARSIPTALANALTYTEVKHQKEQLHAENLVLREDLDRQLMFEDIVGQAPALRHVLAMVERVAATDSTVLISGETGTGKELIARAIHRRSRRSARALIKVNCTTLPEPLVMSELFGHEKGAFTGATQRRIGRFEAANGGTIFLDEVGELPQEIQVALLRVLQEGEYERMGGNQTLYTDVRVIAATNRDLARAIESNRFRSDLFYRLNVFPICLPPLRERAEDIPSLVEHFTARYAARLGKHFRTVERRTMEWLTSYPWPGNVRELQNVIERAVVLCDGGELRIDPDGSRRQSAPPEQTENGSASPLRLSEMRIIESALAQARGKVAGPSGAAARLGMPASTLEYRIRRLRINKFRFRSAD